MFGSKNRFRRGLALTLIAFALVYAGGAVLLNVIDRRSAGAEEELVREAVRQAMITCYAVEGAYPLQLDYLRENYGLTYDQNRYLVSYNAFASNLFPEIFVVEIGAGAS